MSPVSWLLPFCASALLMASVAAEKPGDPPHLSETAPDSAHRVISGVPTLGWGTNQETTFAGALSAALAVTKHPYDYSTLMGVTGLAFRTRWFRGPKEDRWNGSSPIGEGEDTYALARKATGWELASPLSEGAGRDPERLRAALIAAVDAGQPVLTYGEAHDIAENDLGVIFGYEGGGKAFLAYNYFRKGETIRVAPEKISDPTILVPGKHGPALSPKEALLAGLKAAVRNWKRDPEGTERRYSYGEAAFTGWAEDIGKAGDASDADRKKLFHASWWNLDCLFDARSAARAYLSQNAKLLNPTAQEAVNRAVGLQDKEIRAAAVTFMNKDVFLGPWTGKSITDWTPEVRKNEIRVLEQCSKIEAKMVEALRQAIQAEEAGSGLKQASL